MKKLKFIFALTGALTLATLYSGFSQTVEKTPPTPDKEKGDFVHKGLLWGMTTANLDDDPNINLIAANVLKHKKAKGFGVMSLIASQPSNLGKSGKPVIPMAALLLHWGNQKGNVNAGPITKFKSSRMIDGYRILTNLNGSPIGLRMIADFNHQAKFINLGVFGRYKIGSNIEATAGVNSAASGSKSIQGGVSLSF